jgi:iron complex outermembrane receptor protein
VKLRRLRVSLFATSALVVALLPTCAVAQTTPSPSTPPASAEEPDANPDGLPDIVVTAQKRSENLQRVPLAVTAISEKTIEAANITNADQLVSLIPGLQINHGSSNAAPFLRGIGTNSGTIGNEPAVATYVDGVYRPSPAGSVYSYNSVERIEVLKGPQGTLFGRNAAGGVINVVTKDPSAEPYFKANLGYGNFNTFSGDFYASGGLTKGVSMDLSVLYSHQGDGWGKNVATGQDAFLSNEISVRSKLLLEPWSRTRITLIGDYDRSRYDVGAGEAIAVGLNKVGIPHVGGFYDISSDLSPYNYQKQYGASLKLEQDFDWAKFTSITAWRDVQSPSLLELDGSSSPYVTYDFVGKEKTFTQEFNLQSASSSKVSWIVGSYYFNDDARYNPLITKGSAFGLGPTGGFVVNAGQKTRSLAGYAQVTVPLFSDKTHVTGGIRYTSDVKYLTASRSVLLTGAALPYTFASGFPFRVHQPKLTYKASLDHSFTPEVMAYISYSRGYKSGNYNLTNPTQFPTKPETLDAYEIGLKTQLFDNILRANFSAFYYKFHDKQVQAFVGTASVQTNAAEAEYKGVEAELTFAPVKGLNIVGSLTYTDSQYLKYPNAVFFTRLAAGGFGSPFSADASGNQVAFVDPLTATLSVQYTGKTSIGTFSGQVTGNYHSSYFFDPQEGATQPAYTTLDANLSLTLPSSRFTVSVWGKNLGAAKYYSQRAWSTTGDLYNPGVPRTFGIRLGYKM